MNNILNNKLIKTIGIIGGGTAGYLTALALRKFLPELSITLIESEQIPVIGVGEATTPIMVDFLHNDLGFSVGEFYKEVKPTIKHGIRFEWGLPGDSHFNFPFEKQDAYGSHYINKDISLGSLQSILMNEGKSFLTANDGQIKAIESITKAPNYAYHLDNKRLISYLKRKAIEAGTKHLYKNIISAEEYENQEGIKSVTADDKTVHSFDLFIDCSGFSSFLLEKTLKSGFVDYSNSLFTDRAVISSTPNFDRIKPYTTATTMRNGWLWNIPLHKEDHIGYVYSSQFCSEEEALKELQSIYTDLSESSLVRFRSGRHESSFIGNVMAVGNSFAFIEPLESTGIHMIIASLKILIDKFPSSLEDKSSIYQINKKLNQKWDNLKWFLALHFKFNRKLDTPFWRSNHENVDISGYKEIIEFYKRNGPLRKEENMSNIRVNEILSSSVFRMNGIDTFFIGQGLFPNTVDQEYIEKRNVELKGKKTLWNQIAKTAVSHKEALEIIEEQPSLLNF